MNEDRSSTSSPAPRRRRRSDPRPERELLSQVIARLGISGWDLIIVGDGSGSTWHSCCGWASVLIDRHNLVGQGVPGRRVFYGAMNQGSVNLAESMPYLHALQWYDANFGRRTLKQQGLLNVHIVTDSQTIAHWGNTAMVPHRDPPRKGIAVWSALREFRRVGYHCHMHWAPRRSTELNWAADLIAGLSRESMQANEDSVQSATKLAEKAAVELSRIQFCDPKTGAPLEPYSLSTDN